MRSRSLVATRVLLVGGALAMAVLGAFTTYHALLPIGFVLGWLNLVGL
jgi:hypothetical protein